MRADSPTASKASRATAAEAAKRAEEVETAGVIRSAAMRHEDREESGGKMRSSTATMV